MNWVFPLRSVDLCWETKSPSFNNPLRLAFNPGSSGVLSPSLLDFSRLFVHVDDIKKQQRKRAKREKEKSKRKPSCAFNSPGCVLLLWPQVKSSIFITHAIQASTSTLFPKAFSKSWIAFLLRLLTMWCTLPTRRRQRLGSAWFPLARLHRWDGAAGDLLRIWRTPLVNKRDCRQENGQIRRSQEHECK